MITSRPQKYCVAQTGLSPVYNYIEVRVSWEIITPRLTIRNYITTTFPRYPLLWLTMKSALYPYVLFSSIDRYCFPCYHALSLRLLITTAEDAAFHPPSSLVLVACVLNSPNIYVCTRGPKL